LDSDPPSKDSTPELVDASMTSNMKKRCATLTGSDPTVWTSEGKNFHHVSRGLETGKEIASQKALLLVAPDPDGRMKISHASGRLRQWNPTSADRAPCLGIVIPTFRLKTQVTWCVVSRKGLLRRLGLLSFWLPERWRSRSSLMID
jgi:hypothetical protein